MQKSKISQFIWMSLAGFLTQEVSAGAMGPVAEASLYSWVATISGGPAWTHGGKTQTLLLVPEIIKTYTAFKPNRVIGDGEFFLGVQRLIYGQYAGQLGLAVATASNASLFGNIWDDANPVFNNYDYWYRISHTHLAVKAKVLGNTISFVTPYINASMGVAWNNASRFRSTPKIFEALPTPGFTSHSTTSFTYTVGAGLQSPIAQNWQVGVGYEFADWGKSRLGPVMGQVSGYGLRVNHFYTNGMMFNLTYLA